MYNLLIIDDEPLITDAIYDVFIDRHFDDFEIYRGYSGYDALDYARRTRIDILLVDICMPGMSGFDLQREINLLWPSCRVIFLTGHDDFEYARSAMRNQCTDYILKTESKEFVLNAVLKARDDLEKIRKEMNLLNRAKESIKLAIPLLRSRCLTDIIEGMEKDGVVIAGKFSEFDIPFLYNRPVLLLIGKVDSWSREMDSDQRTKIICGIRGYVEEALSIDATVVSIVYERNRIVWFLQEKAGKSSPDGSLESYEDRDKLIISVHGSMDTIQETCKDVFGVSVSFAAANKLIVWEKLSHKFDSMNHAFELSAGFSSDRLLIDFDDASPYVTGRDHPKSRHVSNEKEYSLAPKLKNIDLLGTCLENGDRNEFQAMFDSVSLIIFKSALTSHNLCHEAFLMISAVYLSYINNEKLTDRLKSRQIDISRLVDMNWYDSWEAASEYFKTLANAIFEIKECESFMNTNRLFGFIKSYVDEHIGGDLSLTCFSELLHFHPFYLSRLFKQIIGKSLTEYISEVKLRKAKELLKSSMQVNEVAMSLGFATSSYFIRFFKKLTGQTPQQYRNTFLEEHGQQND